MFDIEEAKAGVGDWKNIQPVLRTVFIDLYGLVQRQAEQIQQVEARLSRYEKAAERMSEALEKRNPRFDDLDTKIREARVEISNVKADCTDAIRTAQSTQLSHINHMLKQKLDRDEFNAAVSKFAARSLLDLIACRLDTEFEEIRQRTSDITASIHKELDEQFSKYLTITNFDSAISGLKAQYVKPEVIQINLDSRLKELTAGFVAPEQLQTALQIQNETLQSTKHALELSIDSLTEHCGDINAKLNTQLDKFSKFGANLNEELESLRLRIQETEGKIQGRCSQLDKTFETVQSRVRSVERTIEGLKDEQLSALVQKNINEHLEKTVFNLVKHEFNRYNAQIGDMLKENTSHVQDKLAKSVAKTIVKESVKSQVELDDRFVELESLLHDTRTWFQSQLQTELLALSDYMEKNNLKLAERLSTLDSIIHSSDAVLSLPTARWLWKGKKYSSIGGIIWSAEVCNSLQSNFIWDTGKATILVCLAGCYRVDFVIFGKQRPTVQLHVNGEPIICAMSGDVAPYMYIKPKSQAMNTYVGQSLTDYIYLCDNSKLQVIVTSDHNKNCVSGYLSLQRIW